MEHKQYRVEVYEIDPLKEVDVVYFDTPDAALAHAETKRKEGYSASAIETLENESTRLLIAEK